VDHNIIKEAFGLKEGKTGNMQSKTNLDDLQNIDTITLYINHGRQPDLYGCLLKIALKEPSSIL
jgi:hypothetical protein